MTSSKSGPKDSLVMASILKDMGIIDYEPRVVHQMLEFTYRYITNILEDAKAFSNHAKKKNLDIDDVKLAIQMQMDRGFTTPPPRDILIDISRQRNNIPLPLIKPHCGPRLPPDRYCLSACNYRLKTAKRNTIKGLTPKLNLQTPTGAKITPAVNLTSKSGAALSLVTKGVTTPTVTIVTRPTATIALNTGTTTTAKLGGVAATPCPLIKITPGLPATTTITSSLIGSISSSTATLGNTSSISSTPTVPKAPVIRTVVTAAKPTEIIGDISLKRKREEDDDYDAE